MRDLAHIGQSCLCAQALEDDEAANYSVPFCRRFISRTISQTQAVATATSTARRIRRSRG